MSRVVTHLCDRCQVVIHQGGTTLESTSGRPIIPGGVVDLCSTCADSMAEWLVSEWLRLERKKPVVVA